MEALQLVLNKLSSYNIITNILPGTILCVLLKFVCGINLFLSENLYILGVIFYFAGLVSGRVGSLLIELVFRSYFAKYTDFIEAEKIDPKISILSTENNAYRTYISVSLILFVVLVIQICLTCDVTKNDILKVVFVLFLVIIFAFSYKKQIDYIKKRVEKAVNESKNT